MENPPRSRRARLLASLYDYATTVAEDRGKSSHRGFAATTAATLLGMGINRLDVQPDSVNASFSKEERDLILCMALSAEELHRSRSPDNTHFVDRLLEQLMVNAPVHSSADAAASPASRPLSVVHLVSNMRRLSCKMGAALTLHYGVVHVLSWRNPPQTLVALVAYTCMCVWPHLAVCIPLLVVLFGVVLPAYLHRHPMCVPELFPVKKRGRSLFQFLSEPGSPSIFSDYLKSGSVVERDADWLFFDSDRLSQIEQLSTVLSAHHKDKSKSAKSQMAFLMNTRLLQNLISDFLDALDCGESMVTNVLCFKNERLSTAVFYAVAALTLVVFFLGRYTPWRPLFVCAGWAVLGAFHPGAKDALVAWRRVQRRVSAPETCRALESLEFENILVDNQPETRIVEIYELQCKDVFKHEWTPYAYTRRMFDWKDTVRVSGQIPHGVDLLLKVLPPKEWKFDFGYASNWFIDTDPRALVEAQQLDKTHLSVRPDECDGWIYDVVPVDQENVREFRRRRLYRTCYRYARPTKRVKI
ncbi:hypothetical protein METBISCDRAFT_31834 [Metschnikowia bicuspidata]|uniref:TECPR1-like DysF domain-containing protein n=1 Tax=Metschnikowia bicuspidata TaxID=27322 RepID=A0A4P9Z919_9ASCO|nr:hypothetical protein METBISCDRAFT_31834 [Metschnikowia bicuspidata]